MFVRHFYDIMRRGVVVVHSDGTEVIVRDREAARSDIAAQMDIIRQPGDSTDFEGKTWRDRPPLL